MQNEYPLLDNLSGPESLRSMDVPTLNRLADEVRDGLVRTIAKVGGHFAPNLGVIELTIAMYHAYGIPEDKVIWDVGHQCYPHKMLTGRWKQLSSIKQYGGISGYLRRDESKYDLFGAGHASTSLSAALGFAKARDLRGTKEHVLAVIGDGSLTGGMALEAMLNIGDQKTDMVVVLNDNNMSIAENVGALATMLAKLRLNPQFQKAQSALQGRKWRPPCGDASGCPSKHGTLLRGARFSIHRSPRWPRYRFPDGSLRGSQASKGSSPFACQHDQGQGLCAGRRRSAYMARCEWLQCRRWQP